MTEAEATWRLTAIEALVADYGLDAAQAAQVADRLHARDGALHNDGAYAVLCHMDSDEPPLTEI